MVPKNKRFQDSQGQPGGGHDLVPEHGDQEAQRAEQVAGASFQRSL